MHMEYSSKDSGSLACYRVIIVACGVATTVVLIALHLLNLSIARHIDAALQGPTQSTSPLATVRAAHRVVNRPDNGPMPTAADRGVKPEDAPALGRPAPASPNPWATTGWHDTFATAPNALIYTASAKTKRGTKSQAIDGCASAEAELRALKEHYRSGYKLRDSESLRTREAELQRQRWTHCR
ncbi:MAG: hypothetical protein ACFCUJ_14615 [Thiotrichales bacterium]